MFYEIKSAHLNGLDVKVINVEIDISDGLPQMQMVGKLATEVKEAGERVKAVLKNEGYKLPPKRIIVNLAPANLIKRGTLYDFPIALGILGALGYIEQDLLKEYLVVGELSLKGTILPVSGILPIILKAKEYGIKKFLIPKGNLNEASLLEDITAIGVESLSDLLEKIDDLNKYSPNIVNEEYFESVDNIDFSDIKGQSEVKRAALIAACGMHNMLLVGPPGSGKSMVAKRIPTIQPSLTKNECMEISKIYSIKGLLNNKKPIIKKRPFRSPHHTVSPIALIGGGNSPMPGEISLANGGVLFLDELPEFPRRVIELLRQPLEDHIITINRSTGTFVYPAKFQLVAAMNPCPCGYYPNTNKCTCSENQIKRYLSKISGPFLDRIDLCVSVSPTKFDDLSSSKTNTNGISSKEMRLQVERVQEIQQKRYNQKGVKFNAYLTPKEIIKYCKLGVKENELMKKAYEKLNLTARSYHKVLRVARTIADLDNKEEIGEKHLMEALSYRSLSEFGL